MNDTELNALLETWKAPKPSSALREGVRRGAPVPPRKRSYRWLSAAASLVATIALLGVVTMGRGDAQLANGARLQSTTEVQPAAAVERWQKLGHRLTTSGNRQQGYWYDRTAHTYSGYDVTVQPKAGGEYLMTVRPLGKPFSQLSSEADAAQYREIPLPSLPAPKMVKAGEPFDIVVFRDAKTGDRVYERVVVSAGSLHSFLDEAAAAIQERHMRFALWLQSLFEGDAGQMHLDSPKLYIRDALVMEDAHFSAAGAGVYFYLPGHGRYVLTLHRAGDRRFHAAGMVNGSGLRFSLEGSGYVILSRKPIAAGGEHVLYVFHEEDFRPGLTDLNRPSFGEGKPDVEH